MYCMDLPGYKQILFSLLDKPSLISALFLPPFCHFFSHVNIIVSHAQFSNTHAQIELPDTPPRPLANTSCYQANLNTTGSFVPFFASLVALNDSS